MFSNSPGLLSWLLQHSETVFLTSSCKDSPRFLSSRCTESRGLVVPWMADIAVTPSFLPASILSLFSLVVVIDVAILLKHLAMFYDLFVFSQEVGVWRLIGSCGDLSIEWFILNLLAGNFLLLCSILNKDQVSLYSWILAATLVTLTSSLDSSLNRWDKNWLDSSLNSVGKFR